MSKNDATVELPHHRGRTPYPVRSGEEEVHVMLPVNKNKDEECSVDSSEAAEAAYYLETLKANRRIAEEPDSLGPGQTHRIETDEEGRKTLRRKRFSAI